MLRRRVAFGRGSLLFGGIVAALLLALTQGGIARPAIALEERSFVVVADTVLVNNMGGIWVGGSMDCTAARPQARTTAATSSVVSGHTTSVLPSAIAFAEAAR